MMQLKQLLVDVKHTVVQGNEEIEVSDIVYDTRKIVPGCVFVCIVGTQRDSHDLAAQAVELGAVALIIDHEIPLPANTTVIQVDFTRLAMANMSAAYFGYPAKKLTVVGVTGTKGKTTTTHMIKTVLEADGRKVGLIGTNGITIGDQHTETANTTPESYELQKAFANMVKAGCDTVLMEVSSQGLMMERVGGILFDVGVFTNISPDHIGPGEHPDFAHYLHCKGLLFQRCKQGVVNADDDHVEELLQGHTCEITTFGFGKNADYRTDTYELVQTKNFLGAKFHISGAENLDVRVNMPGKFSVYNALCAVAVARVLGVSHEAIQGALERVNVKGRAEMVPISDDFTILIDYAHNELSMESLLNTLKAYHPKRMVCIFGCGGNRSKLRRYAMGECAAKMADFTILTEDNNRFEKVEDILSDIKVGMAKGNPNAQYVEIPDRLDAIHYAIDHAQKGDLIALIGKGHESYRDRMGEKTPFLERELIEEYAREKGMIK